MTQLWVVIKKTSVEIYIISNQAAPSCTATQALKKLADAAGKFFFLGSFHSQIPEMICQSARPVWDKHPYTCF